jgi:radical SAM protein with 4Fe4S-binding SPASM domain
MNLDQQLGKLQIGLREHSPLSPRYVGSMLKRRTRRALRLDHWWPGGWSLRPDLLCIFPTYRCNLRCGMCFQREGTAGLGGTAGRSELTPDQWKRIIDKGARFTSTVLWMGGEAFLYPQFVDLVAYAKSKGLRTLIITNGFALPEHAAHLVEIGIDGITVSIDGSKGTHNSIRRHPQSHARAVEGLRAVHAARQAQHRQLPILMINFTMMGQNYRQVPEFISLAREWGADAVQLLGLMYASPATLKRHTQVLESEFGVRRDDMTALENSDFRTGLDATWLQHQISRLLETSPAFPELRFCSLGLENCIEAHYGPDEHLPLPNQRCTSLWRRMVIQPNGDVTACYNQMEIVMGNALHQDLPEIWNGAKFLHFRRRIRRELLPGCVRCGWLDY